MFSTGGGGLLTIRGDRNIYDLQGWGRGLVPRVGQEVGSKDGAGGWFQGWGRGLVPRVGQGFGSKGGAGGWLKFLFVLNFQLFH